MVDTFPFAPERNVPETLPREPASAMSLNGWQFTARPTTPYQRSFKITLHGMHWYTDPVTGLWDLTTNQNFNARLLEEFYESHETWDPFYFNHQHFGQLLVRFKNAVTIPKGEADSGGFIAPFEIQLIHHNPGYAISSGTTPAPVFIIPPAIITDASPVFTTQPSISPSSGTV